MLKQRIITAVVLIPIVLAAVFFFPPPLFCITTAFIVLAAAWEWTNLIPVKSTSKRIGYLFLVTACMAGAVVIRVPVLAIYVLAFLWWLAAAVLVVSYPRGSNTWGRSKTIKALMGILVLVPCWTAINMLRMQSNGLWLLLYLFVLIWGADTAAYFCGKKWGRKKLAPAVSPGKSWEGLVGAMVFSVVLALLALSLSEVKGATWWWFCEFSLMVALFSVIGDLFESMLKRQVGVKDSGTLLPGHGGLLDRIDSLTAAAPVFALGIMLLERTGF